MQDYGYTFTNTRRRSNSSTQAITDFKTKFETIETEPVFEEELHGPSQDEAEVTKVDSTSSSNSEGSEEYIVKKA